MSNIAIFALVMVFAAWPIVDAHCGSSPRGMIAECASTTYSFYSGLAESMGIWGELRIVAEQAPLTIAESIAATAPAAASKAVAAAVPAPAPAPAAPAVVAVAPAPAPTAAPAPAPAAPVLTPVVAASAPAAASASDPHAHQYAVWAEDEADIRARIGVELRQGMSDLQRYLQLGYGDPGAYAPLMTAAQSEISANSAYVETLRRAASDGMVSAHERNAIDAAADALWAAEAHAHRALLSTDLGRSAAAMGAAEGST